MADHRDRLAVKQGHAPQNAGVLAALAVAPLLKEIRKDRGDIIIDLGAARMARQIDLLLGAQVAAPLQQRGLLKQQRAALLLSGDGQRGLDLVQPGQNLPHASPSFPSPGA